MSPEPKVPAKPKRPKPRIPLPLKPGKVMDEDKIYKRKPKHRKKSEPGSGWAMFQGDEVDRDNLDSLSRESGKTAKLTQLPAGRRMPSHNKRSFPEPATQQSLRTIPRKRSKRGNGVRSFKVKSGGNTQTQLELLNRNGNGTGFRDPAFAENKLLPVHRWVPWIAGFSTAFVEDCIDTYLGGKRTRINTATVLDPFAGVGTTLLTATLRGYDAIGFDINPWATLACEVKLSAISIDQKSLSKYIDALENLPPRNGKVDSSLRPAGFKSQIPFYSPRVEHQVLSFLEFVNDIPSRSISDFFRVAFGSVMVSFSNYTYEPSLGSRPGAGKPLIEDADVRRAIVKKLREMLADICWLRDQPGNGKRHGNGRIYPMDFMDCADVLDANSVDLMVTSPPYMNNYHYVRNTRPQLYWLACVGSPGDLKPLEERNLGKFWQTVRDRELIPLEFHHPSLERTLAALREVQSTRGSYGGFGWANYVATYFNDSFRFLRTLKRVLRRNATGVIVIGNSIIQGHEIKTERVLGELAEAAGLQVRAIECVRSKRVGASITKSSVRRGESNQAVLYESTVTVRKR